MTTRDATRGLVPPELLGLVAWAERIEGLAFDRGRSLVEVQCCCPPVARFAEHRECHGRTSPVLSPRDPFDVAIAGHSNGGFSADDGDGPEVDVLRFAVRESDVRRGSKNQRRPPGMLDASSTERTLLT